MYCRQQVAHVVALVSIMVWLVVPSALAQDCPDLIGQWAGDQARLVTGEGSYAYASNQTTFMVADVSEPSAPHVVGQLNLGAWMNDMTAADGYVFVAVGDLRVIDVRDAAQPHIEGTLNLLMAAAVAVSGQYAYVADSFGVHGLRVIDVSTPGAPSQVGSVEFLGDAVPSAVAVSGQHAFVTWTNQFGYPAAGLTVVDVSDPTAPLELGSLTLPGESADSVALYRGYAYVGGGFDGLHVVDVTNPASPAAVGVVPVPGYAWRLYASRGYLWVAADYGGVRVMDLKVPESPIEFGSHVPLEPVSDIHVEGDLAFVASRDDGLLVFNTCERPVFADGFESGDTSVWSATVP